MRKIRKFLLRKYISQTCKDSPRGSKTAWENVAMKDFRKQKGSKSYRADAYRSGYLTTEIHKMGTTVEDRRNYLDDRTLLIVTRNMGALSFSLDDRLLQRGYVIEEKDYLPEYYFQVMTRNGERKIVDLKNNRTASEDDIKEILRNEKKLEILSLNSSKAKVDHIMEWKDEEEFTFDGNDRPFDNIIYTILRKKMSAVIREAIPTADSIKQALNCNDLFLRFTVVEVPDSMPKILACDALVNTVEDGEKIAMVNLENGHLGSNVFGFGEDTVSSACDWKSVCDIVTEYAANFVALEIVQVFVKLTDRGCFVDRARRYIKMPVDAGKESELYAIITERKSRLDKERDKSRPKKISLEKFLYKRMARKGFRQYMFSIWFDIVKADLHWNGASLKQKFWAWKRGYAAFRIKQYGLTEEKAREYLSDYEYAWVNRINNTYRLLVDDKLAMRFALDKVKELLPKYYYFVANRKFKESRLFIRELPDLPEGYGRSVEDVFRLIREKGKLAFKANAGTHGDGFYKFEYHDNEYFVNEKESSREEIEALLRGCTSTYSISEIVEPHHQMREIYPNALSTIRVMVINREIDNPVIEHAYMRIGSSKTGVTDNIGYGGICCYVDKDTGRYYDGQMVSDHVFYDCPVHPDTGVKIEGIIPYWDKVKEGIIETAKMIPQIEYMGYDIAITEDGFRIIEINTHQDLHKFPEYPESVREYLKGKCYAKWDRYYKGKPYGVK